MTCGNAKEINVLDPCNSAAGAGPSVGAQWGGYITRKSTIQQKNKTIFALVAFLLQVQGHLWVRNGEDAISALKIYYSVSARL
jgi:hypothetical protein